MASSDRSTGLDNNTFKVSSNNAKTEERFTRIRVEMIEYQQSPATIIYFDDMTKHVKVIDLNNQVLKQRQEA